MGRLICTFVVRIWLKQVFSWRGSYINTYTNMYTRCLKKHNTSIFLNNLCNFQSSISNLQVNLLGMLWFHDFSISTTSFFVTFINGPHHEKTCLMPYASDKGADQPAHSHSLISAFVVHCFDSMITILAKSKISRLYLVSVAEQIGLSQPWWHTTEDRFSRDKAQIIMWWVPTQIQAFRDTFC